MELIDEMTDIFEMTDEAKKSTKILLESTNDLIRIVTEIGINEKFDVPKVLCLRAINLSKGMASMYITNNHTCVSIILRALYETFLYCYWITQSDANLEKFSKAGLNDYQNYLISSLNNGFAEVRKIETQKLVSKESVFNKLPKRQESIESTEFHLQSHMVY
jgi:hypothetical protein